METRYLPTGIVAAALILAQGCGGDDALLEPSSLTCGPGTVAQNGQCVPAQDASWQNDAGGEASWGTDAEGEADTESEGEVKDSNATTDSPEDSGSNVTDAGAEADADAAEEWPAPNPGDAPCPTSPMFLNCSDACGATSANCQSISCMQQPIEVQAVDLPIIVRTPSKPGWDPVCNTRCSEYEDNGFDVPAYSLTIRVTGATSHLKVSTSSADWRVTYKCGTAMPSICGMPYLDDSCKVLASTFADCIHIVTGNPDAGAANVSIETVDATVDCP